MGRAESEALRILRQDGEAFQSDIMRATGFSRAAVSEALSSLERRRLIRRVREGKNSKVYFTGPRGGRGRRLRVGFTRAAEYPFLVPFRRLLRDEGVDLDYLVYDNGVSVARDLAGFRLDVAVAPVVTLFVMYSLDGAFKIIGPAGAGGCSVLESPRAGRAPGGVSGICTKMSTMEVVMRLAETSDEIPRVSRLRYAETPAEIGSSLLSGEADVCAVWEPYATILEERGARRLFRYSDLPEHVCCAAAVGNHVGEGVASKVSRCYAASLEALRSSPSSYDSAYAALAGIDAAVMRKVKDEYSYPSELSSSSVAAQLESSGIRVPSPESFAGALLGAHP